MGAATVAVTMKRELRWTSRHRGNGRDNAASNRRFAVKVHAISAILVLSFASSLPLFLHRTKGISSFASPFVSLFSTSSCLGLQKVVKPCFLVLNSRQINYGQRSSMRIWNLLEWRLWILIPLFPNTSESFAFACRLAGMGWVGLD